MCFTAVRVPPPRLSHNHIDILDYPTRYTKNFTVVKTVIYGIVGLYMHFSDASVSEKIECTQNGSFITMFPIEKLFRRVFHMQLASEGRHVSRVPLLAGLVVENDRRPCWLVVSNDFPTFVDDDHNKLKCSQEG